jgi:serine O-acetyltransferase
MSTKPGHSVTTVSPASSPVWDLESIVAGLRAARRRWRGEHGRLREVGGRELPSRQVLRDVVASLSAALFPMRLGPADLREEGEDFFVGHTLDTALRALSAQIRLELGYVARQKADRREAWPGEESLDLDAAAARIVEGFAARLPEMRSVLDTDVMAAYTGDPAAHSVDEVLLCYPGIVAILHHRIAHHLYGSGAPLVARIISEIAHADTGIDIHPGATIGESFFIDHGTGVVIGETAVVGRRVRIYQAVTLGAKRFVTGEDGALKKGEPRHPIIEDDVVIYAGAAVLGRITVGKGSVIGGNVWLTRSVPAGSQVTQANALGASQIA